MSDALGSHEASQARKWYKGNASKIKTRVYMTLAVCVVWGIYRVLVPGTRIVHSCFCLHISGTGSQACAHWGCRTTWWQAGPKAEAPMFPLWNCRCSCSDACPQSQPHLGNTGLDYKKIFPVPQLSSSVSCIYSLLLFHILKKNDLRWQCHPFQAGTLEMWSTSNTLLGLGLGD